MSRPTGFFAVCLSLIVSMHGSLKSQDSGSGVTRSAPNQLTPATDQEVIVECTLPPGAGNSDVVVTFDGAQCPTEVLSSGLVCGRISAAQATTGTHTLGVKVKGSTVGTTPVDVIGDPGTGTATCLEFVQRGTQLVEMCAIKEFDRLKQSALAQIEASTGKEQVKAVFNEFKETTKSIFACFKLVLKQLKSNAIDCVKALDAADNAKEEMIEAIEDQIEECLNKVGQSRDAAVAEVSVAQDKKKEGLPKQDRDCEFVCRGDPGKAILDLKVTSDHFSVIIGTKLSKEEREGFEDPAAKAAEIEKKLQDDMDKHLEELKKRLNCQDAAAGPGVQLAPFGGSCAAGNMGGVSFAYAFPTAGMFINAEKDKEAFLFIQTQDADGDPLEAKTERSILTHFQDCQPHEKCGRRASAMLYIYGATDSGIEDMLDPTERTIIATFRKIVDKIIDSLAKVFGAPDDVRKKFKEAVDKLSRATAQLKGSCQIKMSGKLNEQHKEEVVDTSVSFEFDENAKLKKGKLDRGKTFFEGMSIFDKDESISIEVTTQARAEAFATGRRARALSFGGTGWAYVTAMLCDGKLHAFHNFNNALLPVKKDPLMIDPKDTTKKDTMKVGQVTEKGSALTLLLEEFRASETAKKLVDGNDFKGFNDELNKLDKKVQKLMEPLKPEKKK